MSVTCGNERHPDGPGHPATPLPYYPGWLATWFTKQGRAARAEDKRQQENAKRWGCHCHAAQEPTE